VALDENVLTSVERQLKAALEVHVSLNGAPVPVRVVTPDPDFVELELPCLTMQLVDVRRDGARADNTPRVVTHLESMSAEVSPPSQPFNLHFSIGVHAASQRDERLMLEQVLLMLDEVPVLASNVQEFYVARDQTFTDRSRGRGIACTVGIVVKARLEPRGATLVPLAREHDAAVKEV
jgi:hypothetical protein